MSAPPPVMASVQVPSDPWNAFAAFTAMGRWWDPAYSPDPDRWHGVLVEPRVGGSVLFPLPTGDVRWGEVTTWEPGRRYAQSFTVGLDPGHPTTLVVEFSQPYGVDGPTTVVLAHGGWSAGDEQVRERYAAWPHLLGRFARVVAGESPD
jgi:hypothetical protein